MSDPVKDYGWTAVARDTSSWLPSSKQPAKAVELSSLPLPDTDVVKKATEYAKSKLPRETFDHSLRVYYYGLTILPSIPAPAPTPETWLLCCLFHDIGTTHDHLRATHLSFEFWGGIKALNVLRSFGAPQSQAESVCEAIIRHQDPGRTGAVSTLVALVQMTTEFDNMGHYAELVHRDTIEGVVKAHPRNGWSGCFAKTIREEIGLKPWCHTTALPGFAEEVEGNPVMKPYE